MASVRVAVIGAGALGGTFAALLARAGHDVTVTARGGARAVIAAEGIRLSGGFGDVHARPLALERLTDTPDLALVCTKAQDAEEAIAENAAVLDGAPVIVVQNGLYGVATAERLLPHSECFGASSVIAANYSGPGRVLVTTAAPTYIGRGSGDPDAQTQAWQKLLDDAVPTVAIANFIGAQWTKLVVNMLNALPAVTGLTAQEVIAHRGLRRVMTASMREAVRVGMARGVRFGSLQGMSDRRLRVFSRAPLWVGQLLPLWMRLRMGKVPNLGSTLQSIRRGQPTEIDYLNGAVVAEARAAGIEAPINELLTSLVHERERADHFRSPGEVAARFRAML